jgi:DNA-directed RNA polymerase subunit H (RpoH/RPB5)
MATRPAPRHRDDNELLQVLVIAKRSQVQMFIDRGFVPPETETAWLTMTLEAAIDRLRITSPELRADDLEALYNEPEPRWVCWVPTIASVTVEMVRTLLDRARGLPTRRMMLVCHHPPSDQAQSLLDNLNAEVWTFSQLLNNPHNSFLVPEHTPLTDDEKTTLLRTLGVPLSKLPLMFVTDPIARWYGFRVGQVIRIRRRELIGLNAGTTNIYYRAVVPAPLGTVAGGTRPSDVLPVITRGDSR